MQIFVYLTKKVLLIFLTNFFLLKENKTGYCHGCVKADRNVRFSGRHGDLPLRKPVGATLCGRPYLENSILT
jgi:hypothetical protein